MRLAWRVKKVFLPPEAVVPFKVGDRTIPPHDVQRDVAEAAVFTFLFLVILVVAMLVTASQVGPEYTLADVLFETVSVQTTTGLSTGLTNPEMPAECSCSEIAGSNQPSNPKRAASGHSDAPAKARVRRDSGPIFVLRMEPPQSEKSDPNGSLFVPLSGHGPQP